MGIELSPASGKQRLISTQLYLFLLVVAVLLPLLAFGAFVVTRFAEAERGRYEREAFQISHQAALIVDGALGELASLLKGLATSSLLMKEDFAALHAEARRLAGPEQVILLRDTGVRQLLNTELDYGAPTPPAVPIETSERLRLEADEIVISNVYSSPISGEKRVAVGLPILREGKLIYVLAITVPTAQIRNALVPAVPPGWIVGVGDRNGVYVTRSERHEDVTGRPGAPEYLAKASGRGGTFTAKSIDGIGLLAGYTRSDFSRWLFAANVPQRVVEAPLWRSLLALAALGAAALVLSALVAYLFGMRFTVAAAGLASRAVALGEGRSVGPIDSRLREFTLVGEALAAAANAVEERARERERAFDQRQLLVNELNHRVKNTLAIVQAIAMQTLRGATSIADARDALTHRLVALAKAHDVLTRESWEGAEISDTVAGATSPHGGVDRFIAQGPRVWLTPATSLTLALALHELATNAVKYGALSNERGVVRISWTVAEEEGQRRLVLRWEESGGPPVTPPERQGFGTQLIRRSFSADPGGSASIDYAPMGVVCVMQVPIKGAANAPGVSRETPPPPS